MVGRWWEEDEPSPALQASMAGYWHFHARVDLDAYVETALAAKQAGLPIVVGLEVDYYRGRMDQVAALLEGYPFTCCWARSTGWGDGGSTTCPTRCRWPSGRPGRWTTPGTPAPASLEELAATGTCDAPAHPDLIKVAGHRPDSPGEWWDRVAEAAATYRLAAEVSSAGWRKPVGEQYPAEPLLARLAAHGVPFTTASDAHHLDHVADRSGDLRALLDSVGVTALQAFRRRQGHSVPLGPPTAPPAGPPAEAQG